MREAKFILGKAQPMTSPNTPDPHERAYRHYLNSEYAYKHGLDKLFRPEEVAAKVAEAEIAARINILQAKANVYAEAYDLVPDRSDIYQKLWLRREETLKEMTQLQRKQERP